jgi:hypothetical protein
VKDLAKYLRGFCGGFTEREAEGSRTICVTDHQEEETDWLTEKADEKEDISP